MLRFLLPTLFLHLPLVAADEVLASPEKQREEPASQLQRPYLGISIERPHPDVLEHLKLPPKVGFIVTEVHDAGPAQQGGLEKGDLLLRYDDQWLITGYQFAVLLSMAEIGQTVPIELRRKGEEMTLDVTIGLTVEAQKVAVDFTSSTNADVPPVLRIVDSSTRVARISDESGTAWLQMKEGTPFLKIVDAQDEIIFEQAIVTATDRAKIPGVWKDRLGLLEKALQKHQPQRRPRVVLPTK